METRPVATNENCVTKPDCKQLRKVYKKFNYVLRGELVFVDYHLAPYFVQTGTKREKHLDSV